MGKIELFIIENVPLDLFMSSGNNLFMDEITKIAFVLMIQINDVRTLEG